MVTKSPFTQSLNLLALCTLSPKASWDSNLVQVGVDPEPKFSVAGTDDQTCRVAFEEVVVFAGPRENLKGSEKNDLAE